MKTMIVNWRHKNSAPVTNCHTFRSPPFSGARHTLWTGLSADTRSRKCRFAFIFSAQVDYYFNFVGCYADQASPRRDLQHVGPVTSSMTLQTCVNYCGSMVWITLIDIFFSINNIVKNSSTDLSPYHCEVRRNTFNFQCISRSREID